jgi:hypothetical protein
MDYLAFLNRLHAAIRPRTYLEIGVEFGASLALSRTRSVGIDPFPRPRAEALLGKPWVKIHRAASDDFFREHTPEVTLESHPLDLVFIDGLHEFAQVTRDLENIERWGHIGTIVVIHDVLPENAWQASRAFHQGMWTGDTWRIVPFLQEQRPDLMCRLIDAGPTGIAVVSGLDAMHPGMAALAAKIDREYPGDGPEYDDLVNRFLAGALPEPAELALRSLTTAHRFSPSDDPHPNPSPVAKEEGPSPLLAHADRRDVGSGERSPDPPRPDSVARPHKPGRRPKKRGKGRV